jgi:hypothetical protein
MIKLWTRQNRLRAIKDVAEITDVKPSIYTTTGRVYLDRNLWRGFNYVYGHSYYQFSQSFGSAATPAYNTTNSKGFLISKTGVISKIILVTDRNNAENAPNDFDLTVIRNGNRINIGTITDTNYNTNNNFHTLTPNFEVLENDIIMFAGRKNGGSTTRRYSYINLTIEVL